MFKKMYLILMVFFISACDGNNNNLMVAADVFSEHPVYLVEKGVITNNNDTAYFFQKGRDLVYRHKNKSFIIEKNVSTMNHWLKASGNYIYAFWWLKSATEKVSEKEIKKLGKTLFVRVSSDGGKTFSEKKIINTPQSKVLPDINMVVDDKGNASVFYMDERFKSYQVFVSSTHDAGKNWSEKMLNDGEFDYKDILKDPGNYSFFSVSPRLIKHNNDLIGLWHQVIKRNGATEVRIVERVSRDFGKTWEKEKTVYAEASDVTVQFKVFENRGKLHLIATLSDIGIKIFTKQGDGSWLKGEGVAPKTDTAKSASYLKADSDDEFVYVSFVFAPKVGGQKEWRTMITRFDKKKNKWLDSIIYPSQLSPVKNARSDYQDIAVLDDGSILIVWQDYRETLPQVLFSYSLDKGETWAKPVRLEKEGNSVQQFPFMKKLGNQANIYFEKYDLIEETQPFLTTRLFKITSSPKSEAFKQYQFLNIEEVPIAEKKAMLEKRFNELMKARVNKNWDVAWGFLDPVYRSMYKKHSWLSSRNRFLYKDFKLNSVSVNGNKGYVRAKLYFKLTNKIKGITDSDKNFQNREKETEMQWVWFNKNWYYTAEDPRSPYLP